MLWTCRMAPTLSSVSLMLLLMLHESLGKETESLKWGPNVSETDSKVQ